MSLLSDFNAKVMKSYAKRNNQIIYDPNEVVETISSGCMSIDMDFDGGLAVVGRLVEISSMECLTGNMMVNIRINKSLPNTSKVIVVQ